MFDLEELKLINESLAIRCSVLENKSISTTCSHTLGDSMRKHVDLYALKNKVSLMIDRLER